MRRVVAVVLSCVLALGVTACKDEVFESATLEVHGAVEYGQDSVSPLEYVTCSTDEVAIEAIDELDASKVGTHEVEIGLTKGRNARTETVQIAVRDTQPPAISLNEESVTISMGDEFDAPSYVASVTDPVDGDLDRVDAAPEARGLERGREVFYDEGWYVVEDAPDTSKPGTYYVQYRAEDKHGNQTTEKLGVTVEDPLEGMSLTAKTGVLEYSNKKTDPTKLVSCSVEGAIVTADELSLDKVGPTEVTYTVTKGASTHTCVVDFEVRDTKNPQIVLRSDAVTVDHGATFDPYSNVESVRDEVDGDLPRVDGTPEAGSGGYTITGDYDTNTCSKYFLTVLATDRNGNQTTKEFSLLVNDPPVQEAPIQEAPTQEVAAAGVAAQSTSDVYAYVLNTNTMVFHYPSCRHVNRMSDKNRVDVEESRAQVIADGYSPCGHCNP